MKKLMMVFLVLLLIIFGIACQNDGSLNEESPKEVVLDNNVKKDEIHIGVMDGYEPYIILEEGNVSGPYIDIVANALDTLGYDYKFVPLPWSRLLNAVESGEVAFAFPLFDKEERHILFDYSTEAVGFSQINLIGLKETKATYSGDFKSLSGYQIGVVLNYFYSSDFEEAVKEGIISSDEAISPDKNIEKLLQGRVDLILEDFTVFKEYERINNIENSAVIFDHAIASDYNYIVYTKSRDLTKLKKEIDQTLRAMKSDNTLFDIFNDYDMDYYGDAFKLFEVNNPPTVFE